MELEWGKEIMELVCLSVWYNGELAWMDAWACLGRLGLIEEMGLDCLILFGLNTFDCHELTASIYLQIDPLTSTTLLANSCA